MTDKQFKEAAALRGNVTRAEVEVTSIFEDLHVMTQGSQPFKLIKVHYTFTRGKGWWGTELREVEFNIELSTLIRVKEAALAEAKAKLKEAQEKYSNYNT